MKQLTKDQQDLAWACLPKEARDEIRDIVKTSGMGIHGMFDLVFGGNVTSDTEPEEMLMNPRTEVQEYFSEINKTIDKTADHDVKMQSIGKQTAIKALFGDKCLPDKPINGAIGTTPPAYKLDVKPEQPSVQGEPKFKVGQLIMDKEGRVGRVLEYDPDREFPYLIHLPFNNSKVYRLGSNLKPYTKPETKDNMEEKELNLAELLKGCVGEWFYVTPCGEMELKEINRLRLKPLCFSRDAITCLTKTDGKAYEDGSCIIYPSRALYEKYPLDAYAAWMEWKEARKPKLEQEVYDYAKMCNMNVDGYKAIEAAVIFGMELAYKNSVLEVGEALQKFHEQNNEKNNTL